MSPKKEGVKILDGNDNIEANNQIKAHFTWWDCFKELYYEYCTTTVIHCIRYFAEDRPPIEKIFFLILHFISIFCCANLIGSVYRKWDETPVIVSFAEKTTPVWSIPFPAVTICSETKRVLNTDGISYADFYNNLTDNIAAGRFYKPENLTDVQLEEFRTLLQICNTQIIDEGMPLMSKKSIDHISVLENMLPEFERYFLYCKWYKDFGQCHNLFKRTYTEEGICFTFNGLNISDLYRENTYQYQRFAQEDDRFDEEHIKWSLEMGYPKEAGIKTYPARVLAAGARAGLFIALQNFKQEIDYACRGPIQGFKMLLHSPDDIPHVSKNFIRIPMGREVSVVIRPNMMTTSAGIAEYTAIGRQCYLNSERRLSFFKTYTQGNCEMECLANFTFKKCGCVKFSMPHYIDTPICNEDMIHCYDQAEDDLLLHEFNEASKGNFNKDSCNCMPSCTSLSYNAEISQGSFDLEEMLAASGDTSFLHEYPGAQMSRLSIYFKENQFITSKRSELYGVTDFIANCGGIVGLFMGASFLSIIEIVYYFTLRLWTNVRRKNKIK